MENTKKKTLAQVKKEFKVASIRRKELRELQEKFWEYSKNINAVVKHSWIKLEENAIEKIIEEKEYDVVVRKIRKMVEFTEKIDAAVWRIKRFGKENVLLKRDGDSIIKVPLMELLGKEYPGDVSRGWEYILENLQALEKQSALYN